MGSEVIYWISALYPPLIDHSTGKSNRQVTRMNCLVLSSWKKYLILEVENRTNFRK
jgi:hypothetical protein